MVRSIHWLLLSLMTLLSSNGLYAQNWTFADRSDDLAFLGVTTSSLSGRKAKLLGYDNRYGAYIKTVVPGTAADRYGLQPLDYIVGFNDEEMTWAKDLTNLLSGYRAGDEVTVHFFRKGQKQSLPLTLGSRSDRRSRSESPQDDPYFGISQHRAHSDYDPGVRVNVIDNTPADQMGLKDGDVILSINGYPMIDWEDISGAINMLRPGEDIAIEWERVGQSYSEVGQLSSEAERRSHSNTYSAYVRASDYAFLGIESTKLSADKAERLGFDNPYGSYVTRVLGNTAAAEVGLQPFDYVFGIDEYRTGADQSLTKILRRYDVGETATLHYIRQGEIREQEITFSDRDFAERSARPACADPHLGVQQSHRQKPAEGVQVNIVSGGTAEKMGLKDGDVITHINGYPILDWEDLGTAVDAMNVGQPAQLDFLRDGRRQTAEQPIQSECDSRSRVVYQDGDHVIYKDDGRIRIEGNGRVIDLFGEGENQERGEAPIDLEEMTARLEEMPEEDLDMLDRLYDLDMPKDNNLSIDNLRLFPNPSMGMFQLSFELPRSGATSIRIYNAQGREIYNYDLGTFQGNFSDPVDISQNGPGSYYLLIQQDNRSLTQKIILTR